MVVRDEAGGLVLRGDSAVRCCGCGCGSAAEGLGMGDGGGRRAMVGEGGERWQGRWVRRLVRYRRTCAWIWPHGSQGAVIGGDSGGGFPLVAGAIGVSLAGLVFGGCGPAGLSAESEFEAAVGRG